MREYELVYLVADTIAEDKQEAVLAKIQKFITDLGGSKIKQENLGRRRLAYEILKNEFATYVQLNFELEGSKVKDLEHDLKLTPAIIRHLLILKKATHVSVLEEKVEAVADEELEEVIGERSYEQVEGETEESYDLMAKRDKADDEEVTVPTPEGRDSVPQTESLSVGEDEKVIEPIKEAVTEEVEESPKSEVKTKETVTKQEKKETKKAVKTVPTPEGRDSVPQTESLSVGEKKKEKAEKVEEEKVVPTPEGRDSVPQTESLSVGDKKRPVRPKKPEAKDEAERLRQLDEKLDQILGDDL